MKRSAEFTIVLLLIAGFIVGLWIWGIPGVGDLKLSKATLTNPDVQPPGYVAFYDKTGKFLRWVPKDSPLADAQT